jgi:hypothetical protein
VHSSLARELSDSETEALLFVSLRSSALIELFRSILTAWGFGSRRVGDDYCLKGLVEEHLLSCCE